MSASRPRCSDYIGVHVTFDFAGMSVHTRFADILGFTIAQAFANFNIVRPEHKVILKGLASHVYDSFFFGPSFLMHRTGIVFNLSSRANFCRECLKDFLMKY